MAQRHSLKAELDPEVKPDPGLKNGPEWKLRYCVYSVVENVELTSTECCTGAAGMTA